MEIFSKFLKINTKKNGLIYMKINYVLRHQVNCEKL